METLNSPDVGPPTLERIRRAPKVLLHDHLDGGLRPSTIIELADEHGYRDLPTTDTDELAAWMLRGANRLQRMIGQTRYHAEYQPKRLFYSLVLDDGRFEAGFRAHEGELDPGA